MYKKLKSIKRFEPNRRACYFATAQTPLSAFRLSSSALFFSDNLFAFSKTPAGSDAHPHRHPKKCKSASDELFLLGFASDFNFLSSAFGRCSWECSLLIDGDMTNLLKLSITQILTKLNFVNLNFKTTLMN